MTPSGWPRTSCQARPALPHLAHSLAKFEIPVRWRWTARRCRCVGSRSRRPATMWRQHTPRCDHSQRACLHASPAGEPSERELGGPQRRSVCRRLHLQASRGSLPGAAVRPAQSGCGGGGAERSCDRHGATRRLFCDGSHHAAARAGRTDQSRSSCSEPGALRHAARYASSHTPANPRLVELHDGR